MEFVSIDPSDGAELARRPALAAAARDAVLAHASDAQRAWALVPLAARAATLARVGIALRDHAERLAETATAEIGKRSAEARAEVEKSARACDHYAALALLELADREVASTAPRSLLVAQPLGVVLAIEPWNFPYWQALRVIAPALAVGNGVVLKPAPSVAGCAQALAEALRAAGLPPGLVEVALLDDAGCAAAIADRRIAAVTLTGSARAGRAVGAAAGRALKKCVLELGGADPFVVLADADLAASVVGAVQGRFQNCGQSCIAAKRFIVVEAIADEFATRFAAVAGALRSGAPRDPNTELGPMARRDLRDALHAQVEDALGHGARALTGGRWPDGPGAWYPPTVLDGVTPAMRAWREELFGPVASVVRVRDAAEALRVANGSDYGLGGSVWTCDAAAGERFARELACGMAFVNGVVHSDPRLPFGGVKGSGFGRELGSAGLHEFVNLKSLWLGPA